MSADPTFFRYFARWPELDREMVPNGYPVHRFIDQYRSLFADADVVSDIAALAQMRPPDDD